MAHITLNELTYYVEENVEARGLSLASESMNLHKHLQGLCFIKLKFNISIFLHYCMYTKPIKLT